MSGHAVNHKQLSLIEMAAFSIRFKLKKRTFQSKFAVSLAINPHHNAISGGIILTDCFF